MCRTKWKSCDSYYYMNPYNNRLIDGYHKQQQQNNTTYQNNPLLRNQMMFMQQQQQQMAVQQMMAQQSMVQQAQMANMQKIKNIQKMKQIERMADIESKVNQEKIRESVIEPEKIERNNKDIKSKYHEAEMHYTDKAVKSELWDKRTNEPYKHIIKKPDHWKPIKTEKDLIVHKVTKLDKNIEQVEKELKQKEGEMEKHNSELKVIYSASQKNEHAKKFNYNHVYKYQRIADDSKAHTDMQKDAISYYKKQQQEQETDKKTKDSLIEEVINKGLFSADELKGITLGSSGNSSESSSDSSCGKSKRDDYLKNQKK